MPFGIFNVFPVSLACRPIREQISVRTLRTLTVLLLLIGCSGGDSAQNRDDAGVGLDAANDTNAADASAIRTRVRIGHYNIKELSTDKLLDEDDVQVAAAARVMAQFAPDIVEINEIQYDIEDVPDDSLPGASGASMPGDFDAAARNIERLADRVHAVDESLEYPHAIMLLGNSGFYWEGDDLGYWSYTLRGWGEWPGRFATGVFSKYPIVREEVRVIADFAWEDLPDNKIAQMLSENGMAVPNQYPLFEKSLNIVPIQVGDEKIYLVLFHPSASPARFDPINPYRNYDELQALALFIEGELPGVEPLPDNAKFVISGDLNADPDDGDGDGFSGALDRILENPNVLVTYPSGAGAGGRHGEFNSYISGCGNDDGQTVSNPYERYQLQLDYQLPSLSLGEPVEHGIFFPDIDEDPEGFELACHASDHRFMWIDFEL